jgi:hypothetical protein
MNIKAKVYFSKEYILMFIIIHYINLGADHSGRAIKYFLLFLVV